MEASVLGCGNLEVGYLANLRFREIVLEQSRGWDLEG